MPRFANYLATLRSISRHLAADRRGATAVMTAVALTVLTGFAGLAVDVSYWLTNQRSMQGATDQAAYSAAMDTNEGGNAYAVKQAKGVSAVLGYVDGQGGVSVTVNNPPLSGNSTSNSNAYEVIISQPQPMWFANLFLSAAPTARARSVAVSTLGTGTGCVLALDRGNVTDVSDNGNTVVNLNNCSMYVNSDSNSALNMVGQAQINAWSAFISGNYQTSGQARLNTSHGTNLHTNPIDDPYAGVPVPAPSGPNHGSIGSSGTFSPGTYSNISLTSGSTATLNPGVYVLDSGGIDLHGGATLNGSGVTIVLTSSHATYGTATIRGNSTVNLTAPTSGPTAGIAIFQDRAAPTSSSDTFAGGTAQNITGVIYFPHQPVTFAGGTNTGGAICTQLVAWTITFNGNASFNNTCVGTGVQVIGTVHPQLVE